MSDDAPTWWFAAIDSRNQANCIRLAGPARKAPTPSLLLLDVGLRPLTEPLDIPQVLQRFDRAALQAEVLIVRGSVDPEPDRMLDELSRYLGRSLGSRPTCVDLRRSPSPPHRMECTAVAQGSGRWELALLPHIRRLEIEAHLHRTKAHYTPLEHHFLLPSGAHASSFSRVADALDDITIVGRFADWIEHGRLCPDAVLGDTWTILPLLQELATRAAPIAGHPVAVWSFAEYPSLRVVRETLSTILPSLGTIRAPRLLFVASGLASGDMVRRIQAFAKEALPGVSLEFVAITAARGSVRQVDVCCEMPPVRRYSVQRGEVCMLCREPGKAPLVRIDPKKYFPMFEVHSYRQMMTAQEATVHAGLWEAISRQDAAAVHLTDTSLGEPRHLHVGVRVERLLRDENLAAEVEQDLRSHMHRGADVVIIPRHEATGALLAIARGALGGQFREVVIERAPADEAETAGAEEIDAASRQAVISSLQGAQQILILDDVIIRGTTVRTIHRFLQEEIQTLASTKAPHPDYEISAYAVLARPENYSEWALLVDSLRQRPGARAKAYRTIPLPGEPCPWCIEQRELSRMSSRIKRLATLGRGGRRTDRLLKLLDDRRRVLTSARGSMSLGLTSELFAVGKEGETSGRATEQLTPHSLFGERLSESATYLAVAATLHSLRDFAASQVRVQQAGIWAWDTAKIVSAYHDPLIQASFLRAASPMELVAIDQAATLAAIDKEMIPHGASGFRQSCLLAVEHYWAALTGKYPAPMREGVIKRVMPVVRAWKPSLHALLSRLAKDELAIDGLSTDPRVRRRGGRR